MIRRTMIRLRTKICLIAAAAFFAVFLVGVSEPGQRLLVGTPSQDLWVRDDQYMGAALAPYVYCLAPSVALAIASLVMLVVDRRRAKKP